MKLVRTVSLSFSLGASLLALLPAGSYAQQNSSGTFAAHAPALAAGDKAMALEPCQRADPASQGSMQAAFKCPKGSIETSMSVRNSRPGPVIIKLSVTDLKRLRVVGQAREFGPLQSVHQLDLNDDGMPDYVLEMGTDARQLLFMLSEGKRYSWQMIPQQVAPQPGFLYKTAEGKKTLLTTRFHRDAARSKVPTSDSAKQNYLVYDIVEFSKSSNQFVYVTTDNYPVWVTYAGSTDAAPNSLHKPSSAVAREALRKATRAPLDRQRAGLMQELG
jgi:hypothetical protein